MRLFVDYCRDVAAKPKIRQGGQKNKTAARSYESGSSVVLEGSGRPAYLIIRSNWNGKVFAVSKSRSTVGPSCDQPGNISPTPSPDRVNRSSPASSRRLARADVVLSDDLPLNDEHPMANLSQSDRRRRCISKLAEVLASAVSYRATQQIIRSREGTHGQE